MTKTGLCVTGSFCTLSKLLESVDSLLDADFDLTPIFSYSVSQFDTRFFKQIDFENLLVQKTGKPPNCRRGAYRHFKGI